MKNHSISSLGFFEGINQSFESKEVVIDPGYGCSISLIVSFATGLSFKCVAEASIDGLRYSELTGTEIQVNQNGNYLFVLSDLHGIKKVKLSITILSGIADFEIIAGVG